MPQQKEDYTFWTKYKRFATTEILMYIIMLMVIIIGIMLLSYL